MRKLRLIAMLLLTCLVPASSLAQTEIAAGRYDKIIVVIGENLGYENLFNANPDPSGCNGDRDDAAYIQTLASVALNYTNAHSSTHPSLPNYLRLFAGTDNGITEDGCVCDPDTCTNGNGSNPCDHSCIQCGGTNSESPINTSTLYSALKNDGDSTTSFVLWAEGLFNNNTDKFICTNADYVQKHNPAAFFTTPRNDECNLTVWTGWAKDTLPPPPAQLLTTTKGVAFVIPGQDHNGHNGVSRNAKVQAWNNWLRDYIGSGRSDGNSYVDYALNRDNKTLLIITQNEKSGSYCGDSNHIILFLIAGALTAQSDSAVLTTAQYNILKTITKDFGVANLNNAGTGVSVLIPPL